ncbi:MAG: response regulator [Candidatus Hydrogenedentes bacterium]|nr:response regulator [Candidatus Hydrogenedentota bacterium]
MGTRVTILNLEDSPNDAELNQVTLEAEGIECDVTRVETRAQFVAAMEQGTFDLILADYSLPGFDGLRALELALERIPDVPFIFVSGALGEEVAIEALKRGATDYVLKDKLSRLGPAVRRALNERQQRMERERAEKAQREQSEFLRNVFESVAHPFYVVDVRNYEVIMANSAALRPGSEDRIFCYALNHGRSQPCEGEDHPCPLMATVATKMPTVVEHRHEGVDGMPRIVEVHGYPVLDERGEVSQMIEYCVDITDRRRLEVAMRSILEGTSSVVGTGFFRRLVSNLARALSVRYAEVAAVDASAHRARTLAIWAGDAHADDFEYDLAGTPCENVTQKGFCLYPSNVQALFPSDFLLAQMGVESYMGVPLRASSGETLGLLAVMDDKPLPNALQAESLLRIFSARAATELERQLAEQALARLATVVEQATDDIIITDDAGLITYVNPAFERTLGHARKDIEGCSAQILQNDAQSEAFYHNVYRTVSRGSIWTGRITNRRRDGSLVDEDVVVSPIRDPAGKRIGYVAIMRDVTERLQLEAQLRQAQKMEAIGTLAGGIAHDFNNILAAVNGNLELALDDAPIELTDLRESLLGATNASTRAADLVRQILAFSRQGQPERKPMPLAPLVKETVKFLRASIPATIEIECRILSESLAVFADATQMHQIVMNLCTNAYHAMRDRGGKLTVELVEVDGKNDGSSNVPPESMARLTVRDTGMGMDAATMSRIFDPFYTTKSQGEGTGLGLAVVHGIVESHGGSIRVTSEVGLGSSFEVCLPVWRGEPAVEEVSAVRTAPLGHGEQILVVDDEESIVTVTRRRLSRLGYHVIASTDSRAALGSFKLNPGVFDVVITDQTMPHMTGLEMAMEMLRLRPNCPVILCTGYGERKTEELARSCGVRDILRKPITTQVLATAINRALKTVDDKNGA